ANRPLTKTSSTTASGKRNGESSTAAPDENAAGASENPPSAIGATLVNRHSSSRRVGNPSDRKRCQPSSRTRSSSLGRLFRCRAARSHSATNVFDTAFMSAPHRRLEPSVSFLFELERQLLAARANDPPVRQYVHDVGHDVVQQTLIVGDEQERAIRTPHRV